MLPGENNTKGGDGQLLAQAYSINAHSLIFWWKTFSRIGVEISGKVTVFSFDSEYDPGPVSMACVREEAMWGSGIAL